MQVPVAWQKKEISSLRGFNLACPLVGGLLCRGTAMPAPAAVTQGFSSFALLPQCQKAINTRMLEAWHFVFCVLQTASERLQVSVSVFQVASRELLPPPLLPQGDPARQFA